MATNKLDRLRSDALTLPEQERADLAYALIKTLDKAADPDASEEWDKEIVRRLSAIDDGTAILIDRNELRRRFQERSINTRRELPASS